MKFIECRYVMEKQNILKPLVDEINRVSKSCKVKYCQVFEYRLNLKKYIVYEMYWVTMCDGKKYFQTGCR